MKKIKDWKKFENAQNEDEFDYDYVKQCFIDLIESDKINYIDDDFVHIEYIKFAVPDVLGLGSQPSTKMKSLEKIESYIKDIEETKEVMLDIQVGIERVLEEHPEYRCEIFFNDGLEYGELLHTPTIKVSIWNTHH
jgi:hypothetical protein